MTQFISLVIAGLSLGAVYALVALGFVVIYKAGEVLNFAHGSLLVLGVYVIARAQQPLGFPLAVVIGVAVSGLAAVAIERALIAPRRQAPAVSLSILTIGVDILLSTEMTRRIGSEILDTGLPWGPDSLSFAGIGLPANRVIALVCAGLLLAALLIFFQRSGFGVAMRASAEDGETAALLGVRVGRIALVVWAIAGVLAGVAGLFLTGPPTPGVTPAVAAVALRAFPAAILGGMDSPAGAVLGGLIIGVAETLVAGYQDQLVFLGRGVGSVVPFAVMIVVLLVRPSGLLGTRELTRA